MTKCTFHPTKSLHFGNIAIALARIFVFSQYELTIRGLFSVVFFSGNLLHDMMCDEADSLYV